MKLFKYLGQGLGHFEKGQPCQDYIRTFTAENGNIILAVSDGCTAAEFAVEGAKINTQTVINIFKDLDLSLLDTERSALKVKIIEEFLRLAKEDFAGKCEADPDKYADRNFAPTEYSATLLFAVVGMNSNKVVIGHIGDGMALCTDEKGNIVYISDAENIDGQSDMTYFTSSFYAEDYLKIDSVELQDIENIFITSDGAYKMLNEIGYSNDSSLEYYAGTTAAQISHMATTKEIDTDESFVALLDELCFYPLLRADDWSVILWNKSNGKDIENIENDDLIPVIMMEVEAKKINQHTEPELAPESETAPESESDCDIKGGDGEKDSDIVVVSDDNDEKETVSDEAEGSAEEDEPESTSACDESDGGEAGDGLPEKIAEVDVIVTKNDDGDITNFRGEPIEEYASGCYSTSDFVTSEKDLDIDKVD